MRFSHVPNLNKRCTNTFSVRISIANERNLTEVNGTESNEWNRLGAFDTTDFYGIIFVQ